MQLMDGVNAFAALGDFLSLEAMGQPAAGALGDKFHERFQETIKACFRYNGWFTEVNVRQALASIAEMLQKENLEKWTSAYPLLQQPATNSQQPATVGVIIDR